MSYNFSHNLAEIARNGGFVLCNENLDGSDIRIDWRFLAAIDVHRVIQESNFEKIDECIPFLIRSSLSNLLNTRILDPAIGKVFSLSQLGLQYLLFCTKFLDKSVTTLREKLYIYQKQNLDLQDALKARDKELHHLKKKSKKPVEIFPCTQCTKNFESQKLLDGHMLRKHRETKSQDSNLINTIKLELEFKQLKEKLNVAEKELMDLKAKKCEKCLQNESRVFINIGIQINSEEKEKDDMEKEDTAERLKEFNENIRKMMDEKMSQFQEYKEISEMRHNEEITELKTMLDNAMQKIKENEVKRNEIPQPAPRSTVAIQVNDESAIKSLNENENLWKTRFQELGEMYERNQIQMAQSMKDMEKAYAEKMNKLEYSIKQLREEKPVIPKQPMAKVIGKEIVPRVYIRKQRETSESSSDDEILVDPRPIKIVEEIQPKIIQKPETLTLADQKINTSPEKQKKRKKTFSAQKWFTRNPKNVQDKPLPKSEDNNNNKEKAEKLFIDRMKEFGIDKSTRVIRSNNIDDIQSELANRRESTLKTHPYFFIQQKKIKARVEEMFKSYTNKSNDEEIVETEINVKPVVKKGNDIHLEQKFNKKKVLFNLDNSDRNRYFKSNDDSDFDITSLEDDMR